MKKTKKDLKEVTLEMLSMSPEDFYKMLDNHKPGELYEFLEGNKSMNFKSEVKEEFMSHISDSIKELYYKKEPITLSFYNTMYLNSYEAKLLEPLLEDEALIWKIENAIKNSREIGKYDLARHYDEYLSTDAINELMKRFKKNVEEKSVNSFVNTLKEKQVDAPEKMLKVLEENFYDLLPENNTPSEMKIVPKNSTLKAKIFKKGMESGYNIYRLTGDFVGYYNKGTMMPRAVQKPVIIINNIPFEIEEGDYIITQSNGETFICNKDVFRMIYETI